VEDGKRVEAESLLLSVVGANLEKVEVGVVLDLKKKREG